MALQHGDRVIYERMSEPPGQVVRGTIKAVSLLEQAVYIVDESNGKTVAAPLGRVQKL